MSCTRLKEAERDKQCLKGVPYWIRFYTAFIFLCVFMYVIRNGLAPRVGAARFCFIHITEKNLYQYSLIPKHIIMSNINVTVDQLNEIKPLEIVLDENVKQRFILIHDTLWGNGKEAYERESIYFNRLLSEKPELANNVTHFSIFTAFIDLAVCGLSVEPGVRALCYLQGRRFCIGQNERGVKQYESRLVLTISGYGELVLRARCGQIKYADNPVLVYKEDNFSFSDNGERKSVKYTCNLPHTSGDIIACFMKIVRTDNSIDYAVMFQEDWERLSNYSAENNKYWDKTRNEWVKNPNELYSSNNGNIDTGFLMAKCIKHAFKTYPKVRIGKGTELQSEQPEDSQLMDDFYNLGDVQQMNQDPNPPFGNAPDYSSGVQYAGDSQCSSGHAPSDTVESPKEEMPEDDGAF